MSGKLSFELNLSEQTGKDLERLEAAVSKGEALCARLDGAGAVVATTAPATKPKGRGRPAKAAAAKDDDGLGIGTDEGTFGDDELGISTAPAAPKGPTREACLEKLKAFKAKHGSEKTVKVLSKFNVDAFSKLPAEKYADVIALVSKYL